MFTSTALECQRRIYRVTGSELKEKMSKKESSTVSIKQDTFNISIKRDAKIKDRPEIAQ